MKQLQCWKILYSPYFCKGNICQGFQIRTCSHFALGSGWCTIISEDKLAAQNLIRYYSNVASEIFFKNWYKASTLFSYFLFIWELEDMYFFLVFNCSEVRNGQCCLEMQWNPKRCFVLLSEPSRSGYYL